MKNQWSDNTVQDCLAKYEALDISADLTLPGYTSRLLGGVPKLVSHDGGNTSANTIQHDFLGNPLDAICVKGSGWNLNSFEPAGLSAIRMASLIDGDNINAILR